MIVQDEDTPSGVANRRQGITADTRWECRPFELNIVIGTFILTIGGFRVSGSGGSNVWTAVSANILRSTAWSQNAGVLRQSPSDPGLSIPSGEHDYERQAIRQEAEQTGMSSNVNKLNPKIS